MLLIAVSCGRGALPDVPAFEELGFDNSHNVVQQQVLTAYERWQNEPHDPDRNGDLGMLLSAYGKNAASEILYRRARILAPDEFRWAYYLAIAFQQLSRYDEAIGMFRSALEIDPGNVEARIQLAALLLQNNDIDNSLALYQQISVDVPARVEGWLGLGKALDRAGDLVAATAALRRARIVGPQYGEVHYALASVLAANGDEQEAASEFAAYERTASNRIYVLDPLMLEVIRLNAGEEPHMARADRELKAGQVTEAIGSFHAALAVNPVSQDAWGGLIHAHVQLGQIDEAGDVYRSALAAGISYARLHFTYGQALLTLQQLDTARDVIGKAIELDPQYAEALSAMGEIEMQSGASDVAVEQFRLALAVRPNDRLLEFSLAQALNASGQFDEAATRLEPLIPDPAVDRPLALKELAIAYRGLQRKDEALDTLQLAREAALKSSNNPHLDSIEALLAQWQGDQQTGGGP